MRINIQIVIESGHTLVKGCLAKDLIRRISIMEKDRKLSENELEQVSGGWSEEDERKLREEKERSLHGKIVRDMFGNVTFTDKTGVTGTYTADQWNKLRSKWAYSGNPEYYMETINVSELNGVLAGL